MTSLLLISTILAQPAPQPAKPATVPSMSLIHVRASSIRGLKADVLAKRPPVRLSGVVTHCNPNLNDLFIQDDSSGIYVESEKPILGLKVGDIVQVVGHAHRGDFAPCVQASNVTIIGSNATLPDPIPYDLSIEDSRWLDAQYVHVMGVGAKEQSTPNNARLSVRTTHGTATLYLPGPENQRQLDQFIGRSIKIRGVCVPTFDRERRVINGPPKLHITSISQITAFPIDMKDSANPPLMIDHLRQYIPGPQALTRVVKIEGTVTGRTDTKLYVQDNGAGVTVRPGEDFDAEINDYVRVVGQLEIHRDRSEIVDATVSVIAESTQPEPIEFNSQEQEKEKYNALRVRATGTIIDFLQNDYAPPSVILECGVTKIVVTISQNEDFLKTLLKGSTIAVCGVMTTENNRLGITYSLLAANESDFAILKLPSPPPFWSDARTVTVISGLAFVVCGVMLWVILLRRVIQRQTVDLQAKIVHEKELAEKLRQSQKMEAVGRLAGGIAHDFNNLLTVINGSAEILPEMVHDQDTARELASDIRNAGEKAAGLVAQLLTFSRQRPAVLTVLQLNEVLADAEKLLRRLLGEDLLLVTAKADRLPKILGEPILLHQVLVNLAVNARDAMPTGGRLTISSEAWKGGVRLTVSDTGCGMSSDVQNKLFEPFFTTKDVGKGTGLGLATVYGIVQTLGGEIHVHSEVNRGTTFQIDFPPAPVNAVETPTPEPLTRRSMKSVASRTTILLVEDDDAVRSLVSRVLEADGYRVLAAETPAHALGLLSSDAAHLLITDVVMPGIGGRELAEQVKKILPAIRVLFMSGYTADEVLRRGIQEDEVDFLHKPFTNAALSVKVAEILKRKKLKSSFFKVVNQSESHVF